jgi:hypothetical protein
LCLNTRQAAQGVLRYTFGKEVWLPSTAVDAAQPGAMVKHGFFKRYSRFRHIDLLRFKRLYFFVIL